MDMDCIRGSPPRMRGKGRTSIIPHPQGGITPAYAGKSGTGSGPAPGPKDHPRVCGEKPASTLAPMSWKGSPPRMRGKELRRCDPLGLCGITPAYAGKSYKAKACRLLWWDHPRVCGEKRRVGGEYADMLGSPPRMRGKGTPARPVRHAGGITPAYAGKRTHP